MQPVGGERRMQEQRVSARRMSATLQPSPTHLLTAHWLGSLPHGSGFMRTSCAKSCDMCPAADGKASAKEATGGAVQPAGVGASSQCVDELKDCALWAMTGECAVRCWGAWRQLTHRRAPPIAPYPNALCIAATHC